MIINKQRGCKEWKDEWKEKKKKIHIEFLDHKVIHLLIFDKYIQPPFSSIAFAFE